MTTSTSPHKPLPNFVSTASMDSSPGFYFLHTINADEASLAVEVIGPNLRIKFQHSRARELAGSNKIGDSLEKKVVGFLTLIRKTDRHVVAWAESGHGAGASGDVLDASSQSGILPNTLWTRRAIHIGRLLGLSMSSPFDGCMRRHVKDFRGLFVGCHVEVKLAAFAICLLLKTFGITDSLDKITRRHLRMLRTVRWEDGTRPSFEIYFSRKNCGRCHGHVRALSRMTGILTILEWRHRLVKKVYDSKPLKASNFGKATSLRDEDEEVVSENIEGAIVIEDDDEADYSPEDTDTIGGSKDSAIVVGEDDTDDETVNLITPSPSPTSELPARSEVDEFHEAMTAYRRKVDASPSCIASGTRILRHARDLLEQEERNISKPLPPTAVESFPESSSTPRHHRSLDRTPRHSSYQVLSLHDCYPRRNQNRGTPLPPLLTPDSSNRSVSRIDALAAVATQQLTFPQQSAHDGKDQTLGERSAARGQYLVDMPARPLLEARSTPENTTHRRVQIVVKIPGRRSSRSPSPFDF